MAFSAETAGLLNNGSNGLGGVGDFAFVLRSSGFSWEGFRLHEMAFNQYVDGL